MTTVETESNFVESSPTAAAVPASATAAIINQLKDEANTVLGTAIGEPLQAFTVGSQGNFPYYWQNPSNLQFNHLTNNWISANLKANTTPAALDQNTFPNYYIQALNDVNYQLSQADQQALNTAQQSATNQQAALLNAWVAAYGSLPTPGVGQQPIDVIMSTIATTWAQPATNLRAIQTSSDLEALLNNTPASGEPILPVLANYLNALGSSISLQNATTMNNGYLAAVRAAAKTPSATNGGMTTDDGKINPAYSITPSLSQIISDLGNTSSAVQLAFSLVETSSTEYKVSVQGGTSFDVPILDFFTLGVGGNSSYFEDEVANSASSISINMSFTGVTMVNFGPVPFSEPTGQDWYWLQPITDAIANGTNDVSGFRFNPNPSIDFSTAGPFGFLTGAAISNAPTMTIVVTSSSYQSIAQTFQQSTSFEVSFLGIPLGGGSESTYSSSVQTDSTSSSVTITMTPPPLTGVNTTFTGWILGVQPEYPAAS